MARSTVGPGVAMVVCSKGTGTGTGMVVRTERAYRALYGCRQWRLHRCHAQVGRQRTCHGRLMARMRACMHAPCIRLLHAVAACCHGIRPINMHGCMHARAYTRMHAGLGRLSMADGAYYEGDFVRGEIEGRGTRRFANGNVYVGSFAGGEMHGFGVLTLANGDTYQGPFVRNAFQGEAVI